MNVEARSSIRAERKIWVDVDGTAGCTAGDGDRARFRDMLSSDCFHQAWAKHPSMVQGRSSAHWSHFTLRQESMTVKRSQIRYFFSILRWPALQHQGQAHGSQRAAQSCSVCHEAQVPSVLFRQGLVKLTPSRRSHLLLASFPKQRLLQNLIEVS